MDGEPTICPYCGKKLDDTSSLEHVIPRKMGGNTIDHGPNPLKVQAHRACNRRMGSTVDTRALLGWFGAMARHDQALATADPVKKRPVPMGPLSPRCLEAGDLIVDMWTAAPGWWWYHCHKPWKGTDDTWVRPPSGYTRQGDVAFLATGVNKERDGLTHREWAGTAVASGRKQFKGCPMHFLNLQGTEAEGFTLVPDHRVDLRDRLRELAADGRHTGQIPPIDVEGARTFVAKVALGLGTGLLGDAFAESETADILRAVLDAGSYEEIDELVPTMKGFGHAEKIVDVCHHDVPRTHVFTLKAVGGRMTLALTLWARPWFSALADMGPEELWPDRRTNPKAVVVDLPRQRLVGPLDHDRFLAWRFGDDVPELRGVGEVAGP